MSRSAPNAPAARYSRRAYSQLVTRPIMPTPGRDARRRSRPGRSELPEDPGDRRGPLRTVRMPAAAGGTPDESGLGGHPRLSLSWESHSVSIVIGVAPDNTLSCRLLAWAAKRAGRTLPATTRPSWGEQGHGDDGWHRPIGVRAVVEMDRAGDLGRGHRDGRAAGRKADRRREERQLGVAAGQRRGDPGGRPAEAVPAG